MSHRRSTHSVQTGRNRFTEYGPSRRRGYGPATSCGDALCVTFIGFALIIGSIIVQFITEQNYISRLHDINTIQSTVINMNNYNLLKSISSSDAVYITDTLHLASGSQAPMDPESGVTYNAFVMHKDIEMYQWVQKTTKRKEQSHDGTETRTATTYDYIKQWSSKYHNSATFTYSEYHYNPQNNAFISSQNRNQHFWSTKIMLGKYYIARDIRSMLTQDSSEWNDITKHIFDEYYASKREWNMKHGYIYFTDNNYDEKNDYGEPNVGDVRIRWTVLDLDGYSGTFLGSILHSNTLGKYISKNKNEYVYLKGRHGRTDSIEDVIASFHSENAGKLYLFRVLTLVMMCIGFVCTSSLVNYVVSYIPICGGLIGCTLNLVACLVGFVFWLLFFAIAYVSARKEVVIGLIVAVLLGLFLMQKSAAEKDSKGRKEGETKFD